MLNSHARVAVATLLSAFLCATAHAVPERISVTSADALARLQANTGNALVLRSAPKNAYTLLNATGGLPLMADDVTAAPLARAQGFLSVYGAALGITDPLLQLQLRRISTDQKGRFHVHLDQVHEGLPVYGARVIVHMDGSGILGVNGVFVPRLQPTGLAAPRSLAALHSAALLHAGKAHAGAALDFLQGQWVIYPEGLLRGELGQPRLAYEAVVVSTGGKRVRDRVLVDGVSGRVLDSINDIHTFLNREVYTPDQHSPPTYDESATSLATPKGPADPPLINDTGPHSGVASSRNTRQPPDNLWIFDGGTYALYANMFDRKGYDACDLAGPCQPDQAAPDWSPVRSDISGTGPPIVGQVQKTVFLVNQACPNAYWDGDATNYCPGFDGDDVVSHEWSHAYTQYMHGLIYAYQSGALNEGWSDIFGETYDLMNNQEGPLGINLTETEYYEDGGSRWVVGEDLSEEAATLLLRDMWKPDDFPAANPGKATSDNYSCGSGDGGGVHANSSVPNHAYAMLVDGTKDQGPPGTTGLERDSYNGQSFMPGIGMIKAAHIYFYAENNFQTPTTDFPQHANALRMSCQALKGVNLKGPTGALSGQVIDQADCDKLDQAMLATEMDLGTPCPYIPVLKQGAPAACDGASDFFKENWENNGAGWTKSDTGRFSEWNDSTHDLRQWVLRSSSLPDGHTGTVAFAKNIPVGEPGGGNCQPGGDYSGEFNYDSPAFTVPAGASEATVRFDHYVNTEATADGGQLEIKVNTGSFTLVDQANFIFNAPNSTLLGAADTSNNPNGGEYAWNGADINAPSGSPPSRWGTTIVNLGALAKAGDTVQLRFKFTQEGCNGVDGWYVDNIRAYSCPTLTAPTLSVGADYENPDTDGSFTLNWTRPPGATGPDLLQKSTTSCAALLSENGSSLANWTATSDPGGPSWTTSTAKPQHAPNSAFFAQPVSDEAAGTALMTYKNPIAIPATGVTTLSFLEWYYNEDDDKAYVEVSTDNGTTWVPAYTQAKPMGSLPDEAANSYANDDLTLTTVDLTSFAGQSIRLRFNFTMGEFDYFFFVAYGWFVDDISITNDNWGDVLTTPNMTTTLANQLDGASCYRVRTKYPVGSDLFDSKFSNIVNVTVQAALVNLPPVANAGIDQVVAEGSRVALDGSASVEPNDDPMTFTWTQIAGPAVTLADAGTATPSFTAPSVSSTTSLAFRLKVEDPSGAQSTDTVLVAVTDTPAAALGNNRLGAMPPLGLWLLAAAALRRRRPR